MIWIAPAEKDTATYHAEGTLYLPAEARLDYLLNRPNANSKTSAGRATCCCPS